MRATSSRIYTFQYSCILDWHATLYLKTSAGAFVPRTAWVCFYLKRRSNEEIQLDSQHIRHCRRHHHFSVFSAPGLTTTTLSTSARRIHTRAERHAHRGSVSDSRYRKRHVYGRRRCTGHGSLESNGTAHLSTLFLSAGPIRSGGIWRRPGFLPADRNVSYAVTRLPVAGLVCCPSFGAGSQPLRDSVGDINGDSHCGSRYRQTMRRTISVY
jgi:hypothetical protein